MGLLARMERRSLENPNTSLAAAIDALDWGAETKAGTKINETSALNLSAVWAAVRLLANTVAKTPLLVYKRLEPRGKERAPAHPTYRLLHDRPNPEMTPFTFKEALQGHLATWGNAYAEKERNGRGEVVALWPIAPDRVTPEWVTRAGRVEKVFRVRVDGIERVFGPSQIMHVPAFGYDGLVGYSPIRYARESLGLAKASEEFGSRLFGQGLRTSGVLSHPGTLSDKAKANLKRSVEENNAGLSKAHRIMLLEEGLTWTQTSLPPEDAQFLETRQFQTIEVARWFGVPPHKIGDLSRATFSNIEHQSIEFATDCALPWFVRWEQVLNYDLFSNADAGTHFCEYLMDSLLRGDTAARGAYYQQMINSGVLSQNDVRELENMNPVKGGDRYWIQGAMNPIDKIDDIIDSKKAPPPAAPPAGGDDEPEEEDDAPMARLKPVLQEAAERVLKRELEEIRAALKKGSLEFWAAGFYQDHAAFAAKRFLPACLAADPVNGGKRAGQMGADWAAASLAEMRQAVKANTDVEQIVQRWEAWRAEEWVRSIIESERRAAA